MSEANADEIRVETTEDSTVVRTVRVEVPVGRVQRAFERTYRSLSKDARIKGFRPGKVPRSLLEKVHGATAAEEIERLLVSETLAEAMDKAGLQPVTEPDIDATPPVANEAFAYSVRVEVKPRIELPDLKGLPARRPPVEVTDAEVDERIESLRESAAPLVEADPEVAAAVGHTLNIDFEGRVGGELFEGGSGEDMVVELGSNRLVPGFEDQLVGACAGDHREVSVTFPEDYGEESLRGKEGVFAVKVRSIRSKQLPALDEEFAKDLGEDSLQVLVLKIREQMMQTAERQARSVLQRTVMDSLLERCKFDVPPGLVERQLHSQMSNMQRQFEGRVAPEVLRAELARMHEDGRDSAERRVRESIVLEAVAAEAKLAVAPEDVDARLDEIAQAQGASPEQIRQLAEEQGWKSAIEAELLDSKALDFLTTEANVEEMTDT